jgi:hypothetical protein
VLDTTNSLRVITIRSLTNRLLFPPWILFALFYQSTIPVAKRHAWTAQQKLFAIELKRKSPHKKLDDIIVAIKANYDHDVSASTLHAWLKPENATKIEQLVNARAMAGHNLGGFTLQRKNWPKIEKFVLK